MKKLIIISALIAMTGCAGYKVVYTCDDTHCFNQAVLPGQKAPQAFYDNGDLAEINDEQCLIMLNLIAKHYNRPRLVGPVSCNK